MNTFQFCFFLVASSIVEAEQDVLEYATPEAEKVGVALDEYLANIFVALQEYLQDLSSTCSAAVSLQEYNTLLSSATHPECTTTAPEGYEEAERTISKAADACNEVSTVDDLALLISEVEKAQVKVQSLDKLLTDGSKLCSSENAGKDTCTSEKKRIQEQLDGILSHREKARFEHLLRNAYFNTRKIVDSCINFATEHLKKDLDYAIEKIKKCLE